MKTYQPKQKEIKRKSHTFDAKDQVLGRLSTKIAKVLMGKDKITYAPHADSGDYVVVINAAGVKLTGKKTDQKVYYSHSGFPGGFKETSFEKLQKEHPERIIELAVRRMLPDNRLRDRRMNRLKVYAKEK